MFTSVIRKLEIGTLVPYRLARPLAKLAEFAFAGAVARPVVLPDVPVWGVGGLVFGGAGKTWVAIECALALRKLGHNVGFISHGVGSQARRNVPRVVGEVDDTQTVGDEALVAFRRLRDVAPVWVGRNRSEVLRVASLRADVIVMDGLLQTKPNPLARSILVLDGHAPLGGGGPPPLGDLRFSLQNGASVCTDVVVTYDMLDAACEERWSLKAENRDDPLRGSGKPVHLMPWTLSAHSIGGQEVPLEQNVRFGAVLTLARPHRVLEALGRRGIEVEHTWTGRNHHAPRSDQVAALRTLAARKRLDAWLCTSKCAEHLTSLDLGAPLWVLRQRPRETPAVASTLTPKTR